MVKFETLQHTKTLVEKSELKMECSKVQEAELRMVEPDITNYSALIMLNAHV